MYKWISRDDLKEKKPYKDSKLYYTRPAREISCGVSYAIEPIIRVCIYNSAVLFLLYTLDSTKNTAYL